VAEGATARTVETVAASARAGDPDRYLAALLAPPAARDGLLALAAFSAELGRIGHLVTREPMMGEIRLQWWRDALQPANPSARTGNPVADALLDAMAGHSLPAPLLLGMIDAHASDLRPEPFPTEGALTAYLAGSEGAQFTLAAHVLGELAPGRPDLEVASAAAGLAYGLVRLLLGLPHALARGLSPLPRARLEHAGIADLASEADPAKIAMLMQDLRAKVLRNLEAARQHVANLPRPTRVAFLPLALVEPYLRALEKPGQNPLRDVAEIAPLQRIWRIGRAHWLGRM
jgi:15-cis-phytoene synthase